MVVDIDKIKIPLSIKGKPSWEATIMVWLFDIGSNLAQVPPAQDFHYFSSTKRDFQGTSLPCIG
jgi:hypothetical protein